MPEMLWPSACLVVGSLKVRMNAQEDAGSSMSLSLLCVQQGDRVMWRHAHVSWQMEDMFRYLREGHICTLLKQKTRELGKLYETHQKQEMRYRFAMKAIDDVIFEVDLKSGAVLAEEQQFRRLIELPQEVELSQGILEIAKARIHPDDLARHTAFFSLEKVHEALNLGAETLQGEFRIGRGEHPPWDYIWVSITMLPVYGKEGSLVSLLGSVKNIHTDKTWELEMQHMAQQDSLTGLLNKGSTQNAIQDYIRTTAQGGCGVLFMVDIDDFKAINDSLGHLLGDAVLADVARQLQHLFRASDILGRIGGDEFLIFAKGMSGKEAAGSRALAITDIFRQTFAGEAQPYRISGSVGIAFYPGDGQTFSELYDHVDRALYDAKHKGKDRYEYYRADLEATQVLRDLRNQPPERESAPSFEKNIVSYIFEILYGSRDTDSAVQMILGIVGKYYDVSRAYVFENTPDDLYCDNTFEWCNEGIAPQKDVLQKVPYAQLHNYPGNFNEEGVFYCTDIQTLNPELYEILSPQNIHSMLQCALLNNGQFAGYVGFDECNSNRFWNKDEVEALTFISKMLSTFLIKARMQKRLSDSLQIAQSVMDHQDLWAYVIEEDSHRLLFVNKKTMAIATEAHVGGLCYACFWNRSQPCEQCPMAGMLNEGTEQCTMDLYNTNLHVWTRATASQITWVDGRRVCLMTCLDITPYK